MKSLKFLFSGAFMGILLVVFAVAIGYATFIENDFDPTTARLLVYNARWFEVLLVLMTLNFAGMIFTKRLHTKNKLNILVIHIALIIILIGAGITRYFGFEGTMHIRTGETSHTLLTTDTYVSLDLQVDQNFDLVKDKILLSNAKQNFYKKELAIGNQTIDFQLLEYIPAAIQTLVKVNQGSPYIHLIMAGSDGRHDLYIKEGEKTNFHGLEVCFGESTSKNNIQFIRKNDSLYVKTPFDIINNTEEGTITVTDSQFKPIDIMELRSFRDIQFLIRTYEPTGRIEYTEADKNAKHTKSVIKARINEYQFFIEEGVEKELSTKNLLIKCYVGQQETALPFAIKLNQFKLERYPGSNSPSSFASEVVLLDKDRSVEFPYTIYMNHVLDYGGYRFFQSSYDADEKGTVLSVNHDYWGTQVTYFGYVLLFASLIISFFTRHTRFRRTLDHIKEIQSLRNAAKQAVLLVIISIASLTVTQAEPVSEKHARSFGQLLVQGNDGRIMPINTLANQLMIKIHKKSTYNDLMAEQVLLDMMLAPENWRDVPFVRINHVEIEHILEINGSYASYSDFFDDNRNYKLGGVAQTSLNKKAALRTPFDKEIIRVNERISIYHNILQGTMLNMLPIPGNPHHVWTSPIMYNEMAVDDPELFPDIIDPYLNALKNGDENTAYALLEKIKNFQMQTDPTIIPADGKIKVEILYNRFNIFKNLFPVYLTLGLLLVVIFFLNILFPSVHFSWLKNIFFVIIGLSFVFHTVGLIARAYIASHAPWSNGYESMIYISWATILAGFLFMRKTQITLGLTSTLAGITLLTAHMSWMDPEITQLVPVLKSHWLTIHVASITASYGFLGLSAVIGFFNLFLMIFRNEKNNLRVHSVLKELTYIIELSLMAGLTLLIIGNFLGAVWANESWGRYWGWDPKETWTLVTIIFYSFILHMNLIPKMRNLFSFNFLALIGFSTVLMTYFGVNYYLSGLHSYAGGDPVPVPTFVYYTLSIIGIIGLVAYIQHHRFQTHE